MSSSFPDFHRVFEASANPYMVLDRNLRYVAANAAYLRVTATPLQSLLGRYIFDVFPHDANNPENDPATLLKTSFLRVLRTRAVDTVAAIAYRVPQETPDGIVINERIWSATHTPLLDAQGEVEYILQHTQDVTTLSAMQGPHDAPSRALESLQAGLLRRATQVQESNVQLRRLFELSPVFTAFLRGPKHVFELANEAYLQLIGHRDVVGKTVEEALPEIPSQGFIDLLDTVFREGKAFTGSALRVLLQRKPGAPLEERFIDLLYQPVIESDGTVTGIFVQGQDITVQKRAELELNRHKEQLEQLVSERTAELAASELERRKAESLLFQSQKMEAVGNLTGGVAHDFNNLLQVISGNLQLELADEKTTVASRRRLTTSLRAVDRGARLASQLLAFARRQPLQPVPLNLGRKVHALEELLRRTLGERIEVEVSSDPDLWSVSTDPNPFENLILNLAINARDAMERGGKLSIDVTNARINAETAEGIPDFDAGKYVRLTVSDTGTGMPPEVLSRAFEPFFTTKPEGRGTGLGLSMVYGFVRQSGGHVQISSELGRGTSIQILLPATDEAAVDEPEVDHRELPQRGSERVLVVEDDAEVRDTAVELLQGLGYHVRSAKDGEHAWRLLQEDSNVQLLFTDVMMPGLKGPELAAKATARWPQIEVLFTSGYAEDVLTQGGRLEPGVALLSKPYDRAELARSVRKQLDRRVGAKVPSPREMVSHPDEPEPKSEVALKVLVVEDDESIRSSTEELLEALGHVPSSTETAENALDVLGQRSFDVLFTDVSLPGISGVELAKQALAKYPKLRVVLATGYGESVWSPSQPEPRVKVLVKPFGFEEVTKVLSA